MMKKYMQKQYTIEQCKKDMFDMWKWLSENPTKTKFDYLDLNPSKPSCAPCKYDDNRNGDCSSCPVVWTTPNYKNKVTGESVPAECSERGCPYGKYEDAKRNKNKIRASIYAKEVYKLALQIKV